MRTNPNNDDVLMILVPIALSLVGTIMLMGGLGNAYHETYLLVRDIASDVMRMVKGLL